MSGGKVLWTVHVAGEPDPATFVQSCQHCNTPLKDNSAWLEGRVAVQDTDVLGPAWFAVAARIGTDGKIGQKGWCHFDVGDRRLQDEERLCLDLLEEGAGDATPTSGA